MTPENVKELKVGFSHFLPAIKNYLKCTVWIGQRCSVNLRCAHCQDWSVEEWNEVQAYIS